MAAWWKHRNMIEERYMYGARKLVGHCTATKAGERGLVVLDSATDPLIAEAISQALRESGAAAVTIRVDQARTDSDEVAPAVAAAMKASDVIFLAVQVSLTHTVATKEACAAGARVAALTQWVPEMLEKGGIEADFHAIEPRVLRVAAVWDKGSSVRVTNAAGTDITLDITGREGTPHAKTGVVRKGTFHPIPDIEAPVSIVSANGTIVCDASIPYLGIGVLSEPVTLTVRDGNVTAISGGAAADTVRKSWEELADPNVYNVAELGIGMNPKCELTGRMLEDEGVASTCHFGIGSSYTLGGNVKAKCHYDFVLHDPTIEVDGEVIMRDGELLIE